jgi:uncharacterized 2Fe-2S/4Fe-4S cluster protein (DUF4445 family)
MSRKERTRSKTFAVSVLPDGLVLTAGSGELLSEVLERAGLPLNLYCGGRGVCGKCVVSVLEMSGLPAREVVGPELVRALRGRGARERACLFRIRDDLAVLIPDEARRVEVSVLDSSVPCSLPLDPAVKLLRLPPGSLAGSPPLPRPQALRRALGMPRLRVRAGIEAGPTSSGAVPETEQAAVVYAGRELIDVIPVAKKPGVCGLAVDLGTTTVAVELVDLESGLVLGRASGLNHQVSYGADVVSRISFAFQDRRKLRRLQRAAADVIAGLAREAAALSGTAMDRVYDVTVAGNTAMNHFLCGVPTDSLAALPFEAAFTARPAFPAAEVGLGFNPQTRLYLAPNIRSFVGGDVSAGLTALGLDACRGNVLFVDLGTNGEVVVKKGRRMAAASTAVGPAFEGTAVSCGMLAGPGAVEAVRWDGGFRLRTIGGVEPRGVCGSGLVDIMAVALEQGLVAADGRVLSPSKRLHLGGGLFLDQQDVRNIQLAAAAVKTAVRIVLEEAGLRFDALDRVCVAGAFGNRLDPEHARLLGLVPDVPASKVEFVGNASLAGARAMLLSREARLRAERLARRVRHLNLASRPDFQDIYAACLRFGSVKEG